MNNYDEIFDFYKEFIKLEQVIRKGWLMCNVPSERLESVGDHTLQLIMLASTISKKLNLEFDMKKLVDMLLIHDLGEIIIGDISETEDDRELKKVNEIYAVKSVLDKLGEKESEYYFNLWIEMENQITDLAKFAYLIDKIDAVIKASIYESEYNLNGLFDEFFSFQKARKTFEGTVLNDFFEYLCLKKDMNKFNV